MESIQEGKIHQFHVSYVTHTMQKNHRTHIEQVINSFGNGILTNHSKVYQK